MEVFFDSNVFLHHLSETKEEATSLIRKVEIGEVTGFINDIVVSEVIYGYMRAVTDLPPFELGKKITRIEIDFTPVKDLFRLFELLSSRTGSDVIDLILKYRLLPNDALIAATCKHHGIKKIATFDEDFKRVDFLEIITP